MKPYLSILIPTYNHGAYLPRLLDSIISQLDRNDEKDVDLEIIISDNCSNDFTELKIKQYVEKFSFIKYSKNKQNLGFLGNVLKLLDLASGRFLWVMGSDDWIEPFSLNHVLRVIENFPEIPGFSLGVNTYSKDEKLIYREKGNFNLKVLEGVGEIYSHESLGYKFGFISAHILKSKLVKQALYENPKSKNAHLIHGVISTIVSKAKVWGYIDGGLVAWRSGNDSLARDVGLFNRYLVDIECYLSNVESVDLPVEVKNQFISNQLVYCVRGYIVESALKHVSSVKIRIDSFKRFYKYRGFWSVLFPVLFLPGCIVRVIKRVK